MLYLLAALFPPAAVALVRPRAVLTSLILTLLLWFPGVVHACVLVHRRYVRRETNYLVRQLRRSR